MWSPSPSQSPGRTHCPGLGPSPAKRGVRGTSQQWSQEVTTQAHQEFPHYAGFRSRDRGSGIVAQTSTDPMEMRAWSLHPTSLHGYSILLPSHTSPHSHVPSPFPPLGSSNQTSLSLANIPLIYLLPRTKAHLQLT